MMSANNIYRDLADQTGGSFLLGVVGPVRTGKSSFIKRFMETIVIPNIDNPYSKERAKDELPQSASGKTIMTAEPKFVPEEAVEIRLPEETRVSVRLIDCVGYMVDGAAGLLEDGAERMVTTPWFDHEVTLTEAAEAGTERVIRDHSSIGIVLTTDGSFGEIPRDSFVEPESRVIRELKELGKPFALILNSAEPQSERARALASQLSELYDVQCLCMNCLTMDESDIALLLKSVLEEFPLKALGVYLPDWIHALPDDNERKQHIFDLLKNRINTVSKIKDLTALAESLSAEDVISAVELRDKTPGQGSIGMEISVPRTLYYQTLSEETGLSVESDADLITILSGMAEAMGAYEKVRAALESVKESGYGVVYPDVAEMKLGEPQIIRQNGKYGVRLRANAPAIHMLLTNIETEVSPAVGGETASEDIIGFLLQGFDGDVNRIWDSNIFGRPLHELAEDSLRSKIDHLPDKAKTKLSETMQRMINESCSGLICLLL